MNPIVRRIFVLGAALGSFAALSISVTLLVGATAPVWIAPLAALAGAILVARFLWRRTEDAAGDGFFQSVITGAVVTGAIGFAAGFFGPILFAPHANQGPLLGIFVTGPFGLVLGAVGGGIRWFSRRAAGGRGGEDGDAGRPVGRPRP